MSTNHSAKTFALWGGGYMLSSEKAKSKSELMNYKTRQLQALATRQYSMLYLYNRASKILSMFNFEVDVKMPHSSVEPRDFICGQSLNRSPDLAIRRDVLLVSRVNEGT